MRELEIELNIYTIGLEHGAGTRGQVVSWHLYLLDGAYFGLG